MGGDRGLADPVEVAAARVPDVGDELDGDLADLIDRELAVVERAQELEAEGVESVLGGEHTHDEQATGVDRQRGTSPYLAEEMADHGTTDFKGRVDLMRERTQAMQAIWTKSKAEYHGKTVDFAPMMTWPKPVQKPHPPIIVGGAFPYGARRAIAYGDGWLPHASRPSYGDITAKLPEFREMAKAAGRDPASIPITVYGAPENLDRLEAYRDQGIDRAIFEVPSAGADEVLPLLDRYADLMRRCA